MSTRPTPRRPARLADTWTGPTVQTRPSSVASRAAPLGTPTGTQPATSPNAVARAGLLSTSRTRTDAQSPELHARPALAKQLTTTIDNPADKAMMGNNLADGVSQAARQDLH